MKALVKSRDARGLWLEDVAEPQVGINDVKIRVLLTGICGTDLHIYEWDEWARSTIPVPLVIGHEFVGEIVEVGSNVTDYYPGDIVSGEGHVICGRCRNCLAGRRHLCAHTQGVGVNRPGAFAEYIVVPMMNVWKHTHPVPLEIAAIFDPFGNAVHTALSFAVLGEDVLVTGAGPIGIMAAAVAQFAGARYVVITDVNPYRLELAKKAGIPVTVDAKTTRLKEVQQQLSMKEGFDVGLEMSGSPDAFREMLENMSHGGKIAMLGIPASPISVDWKQVIFNMLTIKGIYGREMFETWYKMSVMLESGLDISPVITHRFPWREYEKGFDVMRSGNSGKVILDWREA
ncbi:MAG TPA: L-threonine 3-dehydrogenase [Terriglobales bacterium]|jgi:threonine 3-dehydrogenase|nr:L-threonine 3-dehydrogenase [Terriglobales bacterium]